MAFVCNTGHKGAFYMQKIIPVSESGLYIPYKIKLMLVLNNKIHAALFSRYWLNHIITENWTKVELNVHKVCKYNVMLVQQHTWPIALLSVKWNLMTVTVYSLEHYWHDQFCRCLSFSLQTDLNSQSIQSQLVLLYHLDCFSWASWSYCMTMWGGESLNTAS